MKDEFFSLKVNRSPGYNEISFNVVKKRFGEVYDPLKFIFELSLVKESSLITWKLLEVVTVLNWKTIPISVLPCFSKTRERSMYNGICKYLLENFTTKFVFNLTIQLTTQLFNSSIKYLKLLIITCTHQVCLSTFQKPLIQ